MPRTHRVLDGVGNGVSVIAPIPSRVTVMWVLSGSADVVHLGDIIVQLEPGGRKVCDGLPASTQLTVTATAANTVMEWTG
jgi:hypothetical protein